MATVIFDFDSTLISRESLEEILGKNLVDQPEKRVKIREITEEGIRGKISFAESLAQRLTLAAPTKQEAVEFGESACRWLTQGVASLIDDLHKEGVDIWIVSGGIQESLNPIGEKLGIPENQVHGVKLRWDNEGRFSGMNPSDPFSQSKVMGVMSLPRNWSSPVIAVGDAMSDYRLFERKVVDHFILFTEHFKCREVLDKGVQEAKDVIQLRQLIQRIIKDHAIA